ncbi:hypothetical protein BDV18DRAFT_163599 [Aspergillus unguis]
MAALKGLLLAVFALFASMAIATHDPRANYTFELNPTWEVQAFVDGPFFNLSGPVEKVYAELLKINPNLDEDFKHLRNATRDAEFEAELATRDTSYLKIACLIVDLVSIKRIREGIEYLSKVPGRPAMDAHTCGRVSCSYDSHISWCNDNDHRFSLPGFYNIGQGASVIIDKCTYHNRVAGSLDHDDNWRVDVRLDHHNC